MTLVSGYQLGIEVQPTSRTRVTSKALGLHTLGHAVVRLTHWSRI